MCRRGRGCTRERRWRSCRRVSFGLKTRFASLEPVKPLGAWRAGLQTNGRVVTGLAGGVRHALGKIDGRSIGGAVALRARKATC